MKEWPGATYRIQLQKDFGFDDAAAIAGYLAALGITHLYCSPYLQAGKESTHGYDVLDHSRVNDELGGPAAHHRMCAALEEHGLGQILDIVPNHMAISSRANRWWWDVLKLGRDSRYAGYFDIDWDPPETKLYGSILMPILGDHYGRILEKGELKVERDPLGAPEDLIIRYHEHELPIAPGSIDKDGVVDDGYLEELNADHDRLHELIERQHYRLSYWRTAGRELVYRRFFDVNSLIALRQELPEVFEDTHSFVLSLISSGTLDGLRVDHVDGLRDPAGYLNELRARSGDAYLVVEKILEPGEELPEEWPVQGSTGYDFLADLNALFVDDTGEDAMTELYCDFAGESSDFHEMVREKKLTIMSEVLAADVERLTGLFVEVCEGNRRYRDYTRYELRQALRETIAGFPVYRTYVRPGGAPARRDEAVVNEAVLAARDRREDLEPELFHFLGEILLGRVEGHAGTELALRFQQTTGPVMAKGVEDTAFYNFNRLVSLNEVGGDPGRFGLGIDSWHDRNRGAARKMPAAMLATSTHDTKRSEDVRARINLLSEMPDEWSTAVRRWSVLNERYRVDDMPDRNTEYLFYQTMVGAYPLDIDRCFAYMEKASKETKEATSWINPNPAYDRALRAFVEGAYGDEAFMQSLSKLAAELIFPGRVTSLAQTVVKLTSPGVPDVYQGTELWDLSLVDPDNRRPVDYALRHKLLEELEAARPEDVLARMDDGAPKLYLTHRALRMRARYPAAFAPGATYDPLPVRGAKARHVIAFARSNQVVTIAPRLVLGLAGDWADTTVEVPEGRWENDLTGDEIAPGAVSLKTLLARFPVALLTRA